MTVFGIQHMFAMFGATILVPTLTGLSVSATLLFAGLGTLLFHFLAKGKVPAFLGSSFAFIAGYAAIAPNGEAHLLPYACLGVACAGLLYLVVSALFKAFGPQRIMRFFPPVVTGPIVICIGLILASSAIANCETNWPIALVAIIIIVISNIWGRGMIRIIPILLGVVGSYLAAAIGGIVDFTPVVEAPWIGLPVLWDNTVFALFGPSFDAGLAITAIHHHHALGLRHHHRAHRRHVGHQLYLQSQFHRRAGAAPHAARRRAGHRRGVAVRRAGQHHLPARTSGVLALTRVFDPRVVRIAAGFAILLSFCPKFAAVISCMPACVIGGVSLVLYGMISAVGIRNLVENHVDFMLSRNVLITALILVLSLGIAYSAAGAITFEVGGVTVALSGLAVGSVVGIVLNIILPGKADFDAWDGGLAAEAEADDVPLPLEAEVTNLPIRE